jgi:hypothetical protein
MMVKRKEGKGNPNRAGTSGLHFLGQKRHEDKFETAKWDDYRHFRNDVFVH